jgi:dTDP-4-amino-4,6-dideoxygalactose transaminase
MYDEDQVERGSHFVFPTMLPDQDRREAVKAALNELGVQSTFYPALHRLSYYADRGDDAGLPNASAIADRQLCLPLHAGLDAARVDSVVERVAEAVRRTG